MARTRVGNVTFIGQYQFIQMSEVIWTTDAHGLDQARIPYRGAMFLKKAFEDRIKRFAPMAAFPRMYFIQHSDDGHPLFPTVDLHFIGFRNGTPPPVKIVNSRTLQTVSTSATVAEEQVSMEATYYASRTSYRWIETQKPPAEPRYRSVLEAVPPTPFGWRVSAKGTSSGTVNYAAFVAAFNSLRQQVNVSDYVRDEVVPGKIWACECVVDAVLVGS